MNIEIVDNDRQPLKIDELRDRLAAPFPAQDIEWRVQSAGRGNKGVWARVLAYVDNRAIMNRLDTIVGVDNWHDEYKPLQGGFICGISIKIGGEWVTKWDGAPETKIEPIKGGLSDAEKRAAVKWGIGRYLYNLEAGYAIISPNGKYYQSGKQGSYDAFHWDPPQLPAWALPEGETGRAPAQSQPPQSGTGQPPQGQQQQGGTGQPPVNGQNSNTGQTLEEAIRASNIPDAEKDQMIEKLQKMDEKNKPAYIDFVKQRIGV